MKRKKKHPPAVLLDEEVERTEEVTEPSEEEPHDFGHEEEEGESHAFHAPIPEERSLSAKDPLKRYLEEVSRYSLMDAEEEIQAALKLRETGDITSAKKLVRANLRLVIKIAFEYRTYYSNLLDLIQEGNIGLMKAVSKFDPAKGARLGYYASWWIRSYILKYLLDNFRLVKIGTTQAQKKLFYHLLKEKEKLEAQGLLAGPKLLAERLQVREKDVVDMQQRLSGSGIEVSIDAPADASQSDFAQRDFIPDQKTLPDEALERHQLLQLLKDKLPAFRETLSEKEQRILDERTLAEEPKTLQDIASHYGLTRERARQIEAKLIEKLRRFLT
jgi:RNA polymerase sigma-32 factor